MSGHWWPFMILTSRILSVLEWFDKVIVTFPHTRWLSSKGSFWVLMSPAIGCSALFMRSQTFSHPFKSGDCWPRSTIYIIFLFAAFCNSATMYIVCFIVLKDIHTAKYRANTDHSLFSRTYMYIYLGMNVPYCTS